jgi:two-component system OmpR family response regulator
LPVRILIAEDDAVIADGVTQSLRRAGYAVDCARNGSEADEALAAGKYDLLILDLGLPKLSGFEVLKRLRSRQSKVPVLILTALDAVSDRVRGLDLGADDYLAKPFALTELEARVRALARRGSAGASSQLRHGDLTYDQVNRVAEINGKLLDLSAREMGLLEILLQRAGRIVSKERLVDHMCEWGEEISTNAIEVYMHRLRKKLEGSEVKIVTVRGLGYCLEKIHGA